jgi:hypothetical protein
LQPIRHYAKCHKVPAVAKGSEGNMGDALALGIYLTIKEAMRINKD